MSEDSIDNLIAKAREAAVDGVTGEGDLRG